MNNVRLRTQRVSFEEFIRKSPVDRFVSVESWSATIGLPSPSTRPRLARYAKRRFLQTRGRKGSRTYKLTSLRKQQILQEIEEKEAKKARLTVREVERVATVEDVLWALVLRLRSA